MKPAVLEERAIGEKSTIVGKRACAKESTNKGKRMNYLIASNEYGTYYVPRASSHRPAAQKILASKVHEPGTIKYITENCAGGDIIHAGAYFGDFLPALSKGCEDWCEVWAFEANPENFECAYATVAGNSLQNVRMKNVALGEENGAANMLIIDKHGKSLGGGSRIIEDASKVGLYDYFTAQVITLDCAIPEDRKVSIIHLDIEGYEWKALMGAKRIIEKYKPTLVLESTAESEWSIDDVLNLGYQLVKTTDSNLMFIRSK